MLSNKLKLFTSKTWRQFSSAELSVLLTVCVIVFCGWLFIETADEVMDGDSMSVDELILLSMRNPADLSDPIGPGWLEEIGRDLTALGGNAFLTLLTLAVIGYVLLCRHYQLIGILIAATAGALIMSTALKYGFDRPRPNLVEHHSIVYTASFPSGHSMLSASIYLTLAGLLAHLQTRRRLKIYLISSALLLTALVGISRVYLGVHWPTDVIAGWAAGTAWALICLLFARYLYAYHKPNHSPINTSTEA